MTNCEPINYTTTTVNRHSLASQISAAHRDWFVPPSSPFFSFCLFFCFLVIVLLGGTNIVIKCFYPCRSGGRIFLSWVDFLCWLLFRYSFHPRVTAVARKRSWSVCQKWRWQVTGVALHEVTWCMVVWCIQNLCRDSTEQFHVAPATPALKYTTSVDIEKERKEEEEEKRPIKS